MGFSPVPKESKSQINKAGKILVQGKPRFEELRWALQLADKWRACHAYPINTFQATLRDKLERFEGDPIAAQRLKRMPTIIDKLRRYPTMTLTTMQDIAGLRTILGSVQDVYKLADGYQSSPRFPHELIAVTDYIANPRSEDGYRSLHLIYRYKNKKAPTYNGLRLELQVRTKLQHTWATAVETMGTFLGQALKSRQGDQAWLDFFALVSSAFAHREKRSLVPRFSQLSAPETREKVADVEAGLGALEKMRAFSVALNVIAGSRGGGKSSFYHLIVLKSLEQKVDVTAYDRESFEQALIDYGKVEARAAQGEPIEPVLVSAGPIDKLRQAYPNFFLDIGQFVIVVSGMIGTLKRGK